MRISMRIANHHHPPAGLYDTARIKILLRPTVRGTTVVNYRYYRSSTGTQRLLPPVVLLR